MSIEVTPTIAVNADVYAVIYFVDWPGRVMVTPLFNIVVVDCAGDKFNEFEWVVHPTDLKALTVTIGMDPVEAEFTLGPNVFDELCIP